MECSAEAVKLEQAFRPGNRVAGFRKNEFGDAYWFGRVLERTDDAGDGLPTFKIQTVCTLPRGNLMIAHWDMDHDCQPQIATWLKAKEDHEEGLSQLANCHFARREHLLQSDFRGRPITWAAMCPTKTKNDSPSEFFVIPNSTPYANNN